MEDTGEKPLLSEVGRFVFDNDTGRPKVGVSRSPLSDGRKSNLIGAWNRGKELTAIKPRHLLRLAEFFRVSDINQLISA